MSAIACVLFLIEQCFIIQGVQGDPGMDGEIGYPGKEASIKINDWYFSILYCGTGVALQIFSRMCRTNFISHLHTCQ